MINKQNLWFFTLFSLILVLGVYYITMPSDLLKEASKIPKEEKEEVKLEELKEEDSLLAMRVSLEEQRSEEMTILQEQLTSEKLTTSEKNNVYEQLKYLNEIQGKEESIEKKLKKEFELDCFVKEENQDITTICISDTHSTEQANKIMRVIQSEYKEKKKITVKFQKK